MAYRLVQVRVARHAVLAVKARRKTRIYHRPVRVCHWHVANHVARVVLLEKGQGGAKKEKVGRAFVRVKIKDVVVD